MRSIETRLKRIEDAMGMDEQPVFVRAERRGDEIGIRLPDADEWLSLQEAKESPRCNNVIVLNEEHRILLWRPRNFMFIDLIKLGSQARQERDGP